MELSQSVRDKLADLVEMWAEENLEGKPAILANMVYCNLEKLLQDKTDEIKAKF